MLVIAEDFVWCAWIKDRGGCEDRLRFPHTLHIIGPACLFAVAFKFVANGHADGVAERQASTGRQLADRLFMRFALDVHVHRMSRSGFVPNL
jgi:hypothetical protein